MGDAGQATLARRSMVLPRSRGKRYQQGESLLFSLHLLSSRVLQTLIHLALSQRPTSPTFDWSTETRRSSRNCSSRPSLFVPLNVAELFFPSNLTAPSSTDTDLSPLPPLPLLPLALESRSLPLTKDRRSSAELLLSRTVLEDDPS